MTKIAVIYGSSRPSKAGESVAKWFESKANPVDGVELDLIDLAKVNLPMINEPMPPMMGQYEAETTKEWAKQVSGYDGFVFITAEYNAGYTPIMKNALDTLYAEWTDKAAAIVSYGAGPQSNAAKQLMEVLERLKFKLSAETMHIGAIHEVLGDDGLDSANIEGDPESILSSVVALAG